ncbi:DUF6640 family protein [Blastococcus mobilis]|uniref:Uncharacterized protein n=1 Tax=Blastococcus mobilis TaxID=1938746 RepID=A0A238V706_9ACTN|nr:hypothetical protein SAMN06272737_10252 [Blastococcus mobilis]
MRTSRLVLTGAAVGTIVGTARADLNATHVFNPEWPPHARFHGAAGLGTVAGAQLLALWLLWRPALSAAERDLAARALTPEGDDGLGRRSLPSRRAVPGPWVPQRASYPVPSSGALTVRTIHPVSRPAAVAAAAAIAERSRRCLPLMTASWDSGVPDLCSVGSTGSTACQRPGRSGGSGVPLPSRAMLPSTAGCSGGMDPVAHPDLRAVSARSASRSVTLPLWDAVAPLHQPRARHSLRCGRSTPRVLSLPWPG